MHYKKLNVSNNTCTGCGLCAEICPKKCILMREDKHKQLSTYINLDECINCNLCRNKCPQNNNVKSNYPLSCYAAWSRNKDVRIKSASGGVAYEISKYGLLNDYIVYGTDYTQNKTLSFFRIENENDLKRIQGSKYSFSELYKSLKQIRGDSKEHQIIFIGMPCQIAAIKSLGIKSILLIDIVCHGMPPTAYLMKHINRHKYDRITFRGEYDQKLTIWQKNKIIYQKDKNKDLYFRAFYSNMISYDSCYECKYAKKERVSDITIGDFWGLGDLKTIEKILKRPSLVLCNTERGIDFLEKVKPFLVYEERNVFEGIKGNGRLNNPPGNITMHGLFKVF